MTRIDFDRLITIAKQIEVAKSQGPYSTVFDEKTEWKRFFEEFDRQVNMLRECAHKGEIAYELESTIWGARPLKAYGTDPATYVNILKRTWAVRLQATLHYMKVLQDLYSANIWTQKNTPLIFCVCLSIADKFFNDVPYDADTYTRLWWGDLIHFNATVLSILGLLDNEVMTLAHPILRPIGDQGNYELAFSPLADSFMNNIRHPNPTGYVHSIVYRYKVYNQQQERQRQLFTEDSPDSAGHIYAKEA